MYKYVKLAIRLRNNRIVTNSGKHENVNTPKEHTITCGTVPPKLQLRLIHSSLTYVNTFTASVDSYRRRTIYIQTYIHTYIPDLYIICGNCKRLYVYVCVSHSSHIRYRDEFRLKENQLSTQYIIIIIGSFSCTVIVFLYTGWFGIKLPLQGSSKLSYIHTYKVT